MSTLVLIEHDNHRALPGNASVIAAANAFGSSPVALVIGYRCQEVAAQVATIAGVESVLLIDSPIFEHFLAEPVSKAVYPLGKSFRQILAPASTFGKNILPRVAAYLDVAMVSDVCKIIDSQIFEHPVYAGNAIERLQLLEDIKILTIRTTAFEPIGSIQEACPIRPMQVDISWDKSTFVKLEKPDTARPDLGSAKIIVSGGRGLQSAQQFHWIEDLADVLGAAVGASRAAVDAGFVPNDCQVGQTGRIVAPELYFAIGISGAIQHLAGMKDSRVVVAINKDPDAPIFQVADYGIVGDLFELLPALIEHLRSR